MGHPAVKFTYSGTGSSDGIKTLRMDIFLWLRFQRAKGVEKTDLTELVFTYDGIAVIVNDETCEDLTKDQIGDLHRRLLTGRKSAVKTAP